MRLAALALVFLFAAACASVQPRALGVPQRAAIAHRGASWDAPEHTLVAFAAARDLGADYLELDLQRTSDGVLVVLHDADLRRTTDVEERFPDRATRGVEAFRFEELRELDAGSWFNEAYPERARAAFVGLKVPTLEEVAALAREGEHRPGLYLEFKDSARFPGIEADVAAALAEAGWLEGREGALYDDEGRVRVGDGAGRVIFQSFELEALERLKELAPRVPRVLLVSARQDLAVPFGERVVAAADVVQGVGPAGGLVWPWSVGMAHGRGLLVHPYVVNERWRMGVLECFGADGMFTDRVDVLLRHVGRPPEEGVEGVLP